MELDRFANDARPTATRPVRRRLAALLGGAAVVAATVGAGAAAHAGAAPEDIPWFERPVTVGTGFRTGSGSTSAGSALVSASGRWVAFRTTATDLLPDGRGAGAFVRDRWTDTTVRLGADADRVLVPTVMSHDGNYIGGSSAAPGGGSDTTWLQDQRTRRRVTLPAAAAGPYELLGVNNDGYFLAREPWSPASTSRFVRSGRLLADGTVSPLSIATRGSREFLAVTPSLQFALVPPPTGAPNAGTDIVRADLVGGEQLSLAATFPTAAGQLGRIRSVAISGSGRYVALSWQLPEHRAVRIWDTATSTLTDHVVPDGYDGRDPVVRAVLDDGRIIYDTVANVVLFADPIHHPERAAIPLNVSFDDGSPAPIRYDDTARARSVVATDIDRVLLCTVTPMSSFTPAGQEHCSLKPFPPSPLAR